MALLLEFCEKTQSVTKWKLGFRFQVIYFPSPAPTGFDRIVLLEQGPRHTLLSWDPPAMSNGILVNYTVLQLQGGAVGSMVITATPPSELQYNVTGLLPFTSYNFTVLACTVVDCVQSPSLVATTLEDGKWAWHGQLNHTHVN